MADEMQDWADSDEIWSVSNNTGRRNGKKLNDWMQDTDDWPEQFYIGELKGAKLAKKMRIGSEQQSSFGKELGPEDLWPRAFYEGELKGGKRADRMRAKRAEIKNKMPTEKPKGSYYYRAHTDGHDHKLSTKIMKNDWPKVLYVT